MSDELTGYLEDCCWTWIRDQCRGNGCACRCHAEYPNPGDSDLSAMRLVERAGRQQRELAAANQRAEQAEQREAALRSAIRLARRRDYDGGPCWCWSADTEAGYRHDSSCATLRELLAASGGAAPDDDASCTDDRHIVLPSGEACVCGENRMELLL